MSTTFNSDEEFEAAVIEEMREMFTRQENILVALSPKQAWAVLCAVQLASRHPEALRNPMLHIAADAVQQIADEIAETPGLKEVVRRGWHRDYDKGDEG